MAAQPASRQSRTPSPSEIRKLIERSKRLPDDPLAAVKRLLALPPAIDHPASFFGNQTAILASPRNAFLMSRESDCSLTAFNSSYTATPSGTTYTPQSKTTGYDQIIHKAAGLTTTGGQFGTHCGDPGVGIAANGLIYLGQTTSGVRVGALAAYNSNAGQNQVYTIITKADGTVVSTNTLPVPANAGNQPSLLLAADLNGDGIKDLISVNFSFATSNATATSSITAYLGNADGSFQTGHDSVIAGGGLALNGAVIDDFDGDGKLDIVVPTANSGSVTDYQVTFFPGHGDGTFGAAKVLALNAAVASPGGLVSGDFNGDGKKDLVSGHGLLLTGNGDGTFTAAANRVFPELEANSTVGLQLAAGDFNKDGKLDLAGGTGAAIVVFLGKGDGTFNQGIGYASIDNEGYLTATDLDGDGNLDLYSGDATNGIFGGDFFTPNAGYALMGNGDGTFRGAQSAALPVNSISKSPILNVEDLNGDGKLDYVQLNAPINGATASLQSYLGRGDGSFVPGPSLVYSPLMYQGNSYQVNVDSFTLADVNGDGKLDLVILPQNGFPNRRALLVALSNGDGSFQTPMVIPFPSLIPGGGMDSPYEVTGLLSATRADGKAELIYQFLSGAFTDPAVFYQGTATQVVNGDGTFGSPVLTVSGTYANNNDAPAIVSPSKALDLNGDKVPDLVYYIGPVIQNVGGNPTKTSSATFQIALGNADGTFTVPVNVAVVDNPIGGPVVSADVNGDGKPDLIALGATDPDPVTMNFTGEIGVALGNGDGTFQAPKLLGIEAVASFQTLVAADFDGDGKVDVALLGFQAPSDSGVFFGNGDGTFQGAASGNNDGLVVPLQPLYLIAYGNGVVADFNGDGRPDILGSAVLINRYGTSAASPTPVASTIALTAAPTTVAAGGTVALTATVAAAAGTTVPTGTVAFLDGTTPLGTATINAQGVATLSLTTLQTGAHTLTASYGGDTNFSASVSSAVTVSVNGPVIKTNTTTMLVASASSITQGQAVTFSVTVTGSGGVPTGTVTFLTGTISLGTQTLDTAGGASLTTSALGSGVQAITASYSGDASFNGSSSAVVNVTVIAPVARDYDISLTPQTATVTAGGSTHTAIGLTPLGGFTGAVTLSCTGVPTYTTCSFAPAMLSLSGSAAVSSTLTIQTTAQVAELEQTPTHGRSGTLATIGLASVFGCVLLRRRRLAVRLCTVLLSAALLAMVSGCSHSKPKTSYTGVSMIAVNATSGTMTHTATFTLTVQ